MTVIGTHRQIYRYAECQTAAADVYFCRRVDSQLLCLQAQDRAHRIGQKREVQVGIVSVHVFLVNRSTIGEP